MTLCAACERTGGGGSGREPVLLGEVLASAALELAGASRAAASPSGTRTADSSSTTCRMCGAPARWHRTPRGRWILMEPGDRPTGSVPAGRRWRIAGDGTAVYLASSLPSDTCRVSHFDFCPAR
ncbi:DUF6083 domain-containing protein [Streptomyces tsukubensis]|uniref:Uncharacterized protein n=1 Tax=Streptomyces tsukubensis TaxID=83656 RepID=A0A1V4AF95_9ACTN|nr:DUF6083 domain-containing protein [Streptomyces tsukubensis]OON82552.1 hypothetical protein B1H18_00215 [Streptomyces tsukubensis]QFR92287.1 hypothetical protein GBW32_03475 [Streptomyces tsukubensis]